MENIKTKIPRIKIKDFIWGKKILIIILAVAVILAAGWWVWNSQKDTEIVGREVDVTGAVEATKGYWVITECIHPESTPRGDENCHYYFTYDKGLPYYIGEINGKKVKMKAVLKKTEDCYNSVEMRNTQLGCQFYLEPIKIEVLEELKEATITTDKTEYKQGEVIKLTVKNNFNKSIWYWAKNKCKTYPAESAMRAVERSMGDIWLLYFPAQCPQESVKPIYTELKPKELVILEFKYKHFLTGSVRGEFLSKYKIVMWFSKEEPKEEIGSSPEIESYSNEFIIKEKVEQKD